MSVLEVKIVSVWKEVFHCIYVFSGCLFVKFFVFVGIALKHIILPVLIAMRNSFKLRVVGTVVRAYLFLFTYI